MERRHGELSNVEGRFQDNSNLPNDEGEGLSEERGRCANTSASPGGRDCVKKRGQSSSSHLLEEREKRDPEEEVGVAEVGGADGRAQ